MPSITALIHTSNDALRLGRLLETLYPCDTIVVVDHRSQDKTLRLAREYESYDRPRNARCFAGALPQNPVFGMGIMPRSKGVSEPRVWPPVCSSGNLKTFHLLPPLSRSFFVRKPRKDGSKIQRHKRDWFLRVGTGGMAPFRLTTPPQSRSKENCCASFFHNAPSGSVV